MNMSPVSFRSTTSTSFKDVIARPQAYTQTPTAATGINNDEGKKSSTGKKILGAVVVAGAIAAGLALGKGKIAALAEKYADKKFVGQGLNYLKQAGEFISEKAVMVKNLVLEKLPKFGQKAAEAAEEVVVA